MRSTPEPLAILLRSRRRHAAVGWCCGHTVRPASLFAELGSVEAASAVRRLTSGKLLKLDHVEADDAQTRRMLVNELLARSLASDHTFALARCEGEWLEELGFSPVEDAEGLLCVDMRAPIVLIQDVLLCIKKPHHDEPQVRAAVESARPRLRRALCALYPGRLVLSFDAELLNQSLMYRVQKLGGVLGAPAGQLGRAMCVPYGKILSDEIVPNTVTKTLHVDKTFAPDGSSFSVPAYPGYDTVRNQVRTIKAFRRPVILVDDLLHNGYRLDKLSPVFCRGGAGDPHRRRRHPLGARPRPHGGAGAAGRVRILHPESALLGHGEPAVSLPRRRQRRHACAGADAALHQPDPALLLSPPLCRHNGRRHP